VIFELFFKRPGTLLMQPLVTEPQMLPVTGGMEGQMNAEASLRCRVMLPRENADPTDDKMLKQELKTFCRKLVALCHEHNGGLTAVSDKADEALFEAWVSKFKLSQQNVLRRARLRPVPRKHILKAFQKVEGVGKRAPRNINPMMPEVLSRLGPLVYKIEKLLSVLPCLSKGLTIGQRDNLLSHLQGRGIRESDFSLYDRTFGLFARELEYALAEIVLSREEYVEFRFLTRLVVESLMIHVDGWIVEALRQRFSGEPGTSIFNGLFNLFWQYHAASLTHRTEEFLTWANLSLMRVEGDDGLDTFNEIDELLRAGVHLGLTVKIDDKPDLLLASFLGRVHGVDRFGKFRSLCDLPRALKKYHLSARPAGPSSRLGLLASKSLSYLATDYRSPVIGAVAWSCLRRSGMPTDSELSVNRERFGLSDLAISDLRDLPAPVFDQNLAATYAHHYHITIPFQRDLHERWVAFGYGADQPPPLTETPSEAAHMQWAY
jgi:hypothetical protein